VSDPRLDDLWQNVLARWDDDAAHAAFLDHCRALKQLGVAASRYREEVKKASAYREDTTRVETAQKRLNAVALLAVIELDATRSEPVSRAQTMIKVVSWIAAALLFGLSLFTLVKFVMR
jgi:hypothetical protein